MSSLVHRAHKVPSEQRLKNEEISHIEKQLEINSYPRFFIKRAANDVERRITSKNREVEDQSNTEASREMLVISWQNGLRLLSSRLSGYRQKIDGHVLIGRCDDLRTDRTGSESNSKIDISEVVFQFSWPGSFFPFIFVGSCIVRTFCIC